MLNKKILTALTITAVAFMLTACSQHKDENVEIQTALQFDASFAGTRTITMTFPKNTVGIGSSSESSLDKVVQKYCPDTMDYVKNITDGKIVYSFTLPFSSAHDYSSKVTNIIGSSVKVAFSNPHSVMTHGWKLSEDFESSQLLSWIAEGAEAEQFEDLSFHSAETKTTASFMDSQAETTPVISVNRLSGYPVQKIRIDTVNQKDVFDRTITFTISQTTFDELNTQLSNYFKEITDSAAKAEWLLENSSYLYKVSFEDISLQELEGYTNNLLNSVYCDAAYTDKSVGSTALAEQNSFTETLDFSNHISNSNTNVPIEHTYRVDGSAELSECLLYDNGEWTAATDLLDENKYSKLSAVKSTDSLIRLRINDGKQYTCSSIDVNCTPLENNHLQKSVTFKYDIATGGNEAADYTQSYFKSMNIPAERSAEGGKSTCTVTFTGTPEEISYSLSNIFGSANKLKFSDYVPFMTLRTTKKFSDHVDFSSLIVGKNIDTPVYYSVTPQNGDILKAVYNNDTGFSPDDNGTVSVRLESVDSDISFDVSTPNAGDIVAMCICSGIIILCGIAGIFLLKNKKEWFSLPTAENTPSLPESPKGIIPSPKRKKDKK